MAQVNVAVNGSSYLLGCEDGQEEQLRALVAEIDGRVRALVRQSGQMAGEGRLLLMVALTLADELRSARGETEGLQAALRAAEAGAAGRSTDIAISEADLTALAARLEDVAARLDRA